MYSFLDERYRASGGSEEVGALLGSMSLLPDGGTADPAVWGDWLEHVARVRRGEVDPVMRITREMGQ